MGREAISSETRTGRSNAMPVELMSAIDEATKVVIVGAGFGGLAAAKALRNTSASVVLIDRTNYHLFEPLLYQVATSVLTPGQIASPIRGILRRQKNATVILARSRESTRKRNASS